MNKEKELFYARIIYRKDCINYHNIYWLGVVDTKKSEDWNKVGLRGYVYKSLLLDKKYEGTIQKWFYAYNSIKKFKTLKDMKNDMMVELL